VFKQNTPDPSVIAEDLGFLTDNVRTMLKDSGFPGMKVLQFAFDSREKSDYLPFRYSPNSVVYTGTHDNDTILGWTESAPANDVTYAMHYLRAATKKDVVREMMLAALSSVSNTCILTMQDLVGLGSEARMNTPSTVGKNWRWRIRKEQLSQESSDFLKTYTTLYGRV
jgi:4-alpha-glucanotransferase